MSEFDDAASALAEAVFNLRQALAPMTEAVDGYRADAEQRGYSRDEASRMAADYHSLLVVMLRNALTNNNANPNTGGDPT